MTDRSGVSDLVDRFAALGDQPVPPRLVARFLALTDLERETVVDRLLAAGQRRIVADLTDAQARHLQDERRAEEERIAADADPETVKAMQDKERRSASGVLVDMAAERWEMAQGEDGAAYAVTYTGPRVVRALRGRLSVRQELAAAYNRKAGRPPPQQALADALLVLEGWAMAAGRQTFPLRVAAHDGAYLLDLGWPNGSTVELTEQGWHVTVDSPVNWRRTELTGPLPDPRGVRGDLGRLRQLLNVTDEAWPLVRGWLLAALLGRGPVPVLWLVAEQGAAKTTMTRMLASVIDASPAQVRKAPRDADQWVTAAQGSWLVALDNVSTIPDWLSDSMCRAVTGDGDVRRALYSDGDLAVFAFRRALALNTVDAGPLRGDLADRLVIVELGRIDEAHYREDQEVAAAWRAAHPVVLAGLLDLAVATLAALPGVRLERAPRMADFARLLAAADEVTGDDALGTYREQRERTAQDVVEGDHVAQAVVAFIAAARPHQWEGTAGELLELLDRRRGDERPPQKWPTSPRALAGRLRRAAPSLRATGVAVDFDRQGHDRERVIGIEEIKVGNDRPHRPHRPRTGPDQEKHADGTGGADRPRPSATVRGPQAADQDKRAPADGADGADDDSGPFSCDSPEPLFDAEDRWADEL